MDEIRIVGPGTGRGDPYPICKKRAVGQSKHAPILIRCARMLNPSFIVQSV